MLFKTVVCGDPSSGKELREKFFGRGFQSKYMMTIGAEYALREETFFGIDFRFQIWHLMSSKRFGAVRSVYYLGALSGIIIFDCTNRDSFEVLEDWIKDLLNHNGKGVIPFVIVGNNRDKAVNPAISNEIACRYAEKLSEMTKPYFFNVPYVEISTATGENVKEILQTIAGCYLNYVKKDFLYEQKNIFLTSKEA